MVGRRGRWREVHVSLRVCVSIRKEGRRDEWIGLERVSRRRRDRRPDS